MIKQSIVAFLLITILVSSSAVAQELTKEEKRARRKMARSLLKEANQLIDEGNYDRALVVTDSLLDFDSSNPDAFYNKGLILLKTGDSVNAVTTLEEGAQAAPLSTRIRLLLARIQIANGELDKATGHLDMVLKVKPHQSEALYLRGLVHAQKNETAQAIELFKKALELTLEKGD